MSTSPTPVRATPLRTMRRSAPIPRQLLPALLSVLAGCVTISDDEYAWRLKEGTTDGGTTAATMGMEKAVLAEARSRSSTQTPMPTDLAIPRVRSGPVSSPMAPR